MTIGGLLGEKELVVACPALVAQHVNENRVVVLGAVDVDEEGAAALGACGC